MTYRSEIIDVLEVKHDGETERTEVGDTSVVHKVLASEESWSAGHELQIVEPQHSPDDFSQVESIVVESFERAVEIGFRLTINLDWDEVVAPTKKKLIRHRPHHKKVFLKLIV